jgi:adenosylhomocysteine nucleosidase
MKILILGALDTEISTLNRLIDAKLNNDFYFANVNKNEIYLAVTGVGIMNATFSTLKFIKQINPDNVINIGTAGSHRIDIKDGDIIICEKAIYHGGYVLNGSSISNSEIMLDTFLIHSGNTKLSKLIDRIKVDTNVYHGATLSGDFFTKDVETIKSLNNKYHHLCEDMETIAIYKVCYKEKIPAIAIRIISNNELLGTKYEDNNLKVNIKLQSIIAELLHHLK